MTSPLRGIGIALVALLMFSSSDVFGKILIRSIPATEIAWIRYVVFVALAGVLVARDGGRHRLWLRTRHPWGQVLRGLGMVGSAVGFNASTRYLPLAEATAIYYILLLAVPMLGEKVGPWRWAGAAAGMIGVLVVGRPGSSAFQPAALITIAGATSWAFASILTRKLSGERGTVTLLWTALTGLAALTLILPVGFVWPTLPELGLGLLVGLFSSCANYLLILAYRQAPASTLAPFSYLQLIYSGTFGWLVFGNLPDAMTFLGLGIILAAGALNAWRERMGRA
jgi:drug/metabolite transporter (DMT)-like permease